DRAVEEIRPEGSTRERVRVVRPLRVAREPPERQLEDLVPRLERRGDHPEVGKEGDPDPGDREQRDEGPAPARRRRPAHATSPRRNSRSWIRVSANAKANSTIEAAAAS